MDIPTRCPNEKNTQIHPTYVSESLRKKGKKVGRGRQSEILPSATVNETNPIVESIFQP